MNPPYADAWYNDTAPEVVVLKTCRQSIKNFNYVVVDPGSRLAVIVDPAWEMETIDQALLSTGAIPRGILITHAHPDHIDLAAPLADKYQCPIWMSKQEIAASAFHGKHLIAIDTTPWAVGQMLIEPIFTPGHTPGCMCYLIGDNLFSGDVLFAEGCGMCSSVQAAHAMFASLESLKKRLKPCTRIFPGHSYGQPAGQLLSRVLKDNMYLQFADQNAFAAFRLRAGQNTARMFSFS